MSILIEENVPLYNRTTLRVGGKARYFTVVQSLEEVEEAGRFAKQNALPLLVLGEGSNLFFSDEGYAGLVVCNKIKGIDYIQDGNEVRLTCGAGEILDEVVADSVEKKYWGLENLSAIPGTVGAVPVQNVGAYGVEVSDLILEVETYNYVTETKNRLSREDCDFGYRESFFKTGAGREHIITAVHFKLNKNPNPKIHYADLAKRFSGDNVSQSDIRQTVIDIRSSKFPDWHKVGTAGSFFKNPVISKEQAIKLQEKYPDLPTYNEGDQVKVSLGYILDKVCHLKGYRKGAVELFEKQALVLINHGEKNGKEVENFVKGIIEKVFQTTEIEIYPEVNFIK